MDLRPRLLTACAAAILSLALAAQGTDGALLARARAIHERVLTIDTHIDFDVAHFTAECNYTRRLITQANLPKMREGALDVAFLVVHVAQGPLRRRVIRTLIAWRWRSSTPCTG